MRKGDESSFKPISAFRLGPRSPAAPLRCGLRVIERGETERRFETPQLALVYIIEGQAVYRGPDGTARPVPRGSFFLRLPGVRHYTTFAAGTVSAYVAVPAPALDLLRAVGALDPERPVRATGCGPEVAERFTELAHRLDEAPESGLGSVARDLLGLIVELLEAATAFERRGADSFLARARALLEAAATDRRAVATVAAAIGMNPTTFRLRFARETGEAPSRYRLRHRMERAASLLSAGVSIAETARKLGYPDVYVFTAQFRRFIGMPPGRYRATFL